MFVVVVWTWICRKWLHQNQNHCSSQIENSQRCHNVTVLPFCNKTDLYRPIILGNNASFLVTDQLFQATVTRVNVTLRKTLPVNVRWDVETLSRCVYTLMESIKIICFKVFEIFNGWHKPKYSFTINIRRSHQWIAIWPDDLLEFPEILNPVF